MITKYFKVEDEAALRQAIPFAYDQSESGEYFWKKSDPDYVIIPIGTITNDDAEYDEDGVCISPPTTQEGYFANLTLIDESLISSVDSAAFIIPDPSTPNLKLFGV